MTPVLPIGSIQQGAAPKAFRLLLPPSLGLHLRVDRPALQEQESAFLSTPEQSPGMVGMHLPQAQGPRLRPRTPTRYSRKVTG